MRRTLSGDLAFGVQSEDKNLPVLSSLVGSGLRRHKGFSLFDQSNDARTVFVELKTRTFAHDKQPTTMIGQNKINACQPGIRYIFAFCFTDGVWQVDQEPELFAKFEVKPFRRWDRGAVDKEALYCYIPVEHLKPVPSASRS